MVSVLHIFFFFLGTVEGVPDIGLKEKHGHSFGAEPPETSSSVKCSSVAVAAGSSLIRSAACASPPSSSLPLPVVIKEEPPSPFSVTSELDPDNKITNYAHSTTPELPVALDTNALGKSVWCSEANSPANYAFYRLVIVMLYILFVQRFRPGLVKKIFFLFLFLYGTLQKLPTAWGHLLTESLSPTKQMAKSLQHAKRNHQRRS